jgi:hypothetical protein
MSPKTAIPGRKALPPAFTYTQARAAGISAERLYAYRAKGLVDQIARGLYRWADAPEIDQDLLEIAHRAPKVTSCPVLFGLSQIDFPFRGSGARIPLGAPYFCISGACLTRDAPPPCICTRRNEKCSTGQPNDVIRTE